MFLLRELRKLTGRLETPLPHYKERHRTLGDVDAPRSLRLCCGNRSYDMRLPIQFPSALPIPREEMYLLPQHALKEQGRNFIANFGVTTF